MKKLKEATRELHEQTETTVDIMNRMFSLDDYTRLLEKFYRFYSAIEPKIAAADLGGFGLDFDKRRKTSLLENDLKNVNGKTDMAEWTDLPAVDSAAQAFGCLYVLEGATLGGQVITRHLKEHLKLTSENGGSFFNSYGAEVGPMWKAFGEATTKFAEENNDDETIIDAAKGTFDSFRRCMAETQQAVV
ncbi:MAG: biliverdin-producing heme oxygenase [Chloracidobacterium sp.]|nr:biliverdin-producing heme oxygenase [Chloracidobacterium sp.]